MRLTSAREKRAPYRCQCLFLGDESLRYLAAQMRAARKTRCRVQCMPKRKIGRASQELLTETCEKKGSENSPLATRGSFDLSRSR